MDKTLNNFWTKLKEIFDTVRQKPMLVYGIGCLLLAVFSFFFTYYLRVIYSPAWLGQINGTVGITVSLCVMWTAFCFAARFKDSNQPLFMTILLFVLGVVFVFATPPNLVPDEHTHYLRSSPRPDRPAVRAEWRCMDRQDCRGCRKADSGIGGDRSRHPHGRERDSAHFHTYAPRGCQW